MYNEALNDKIFETVSKTNKQLPLVGYHQFVRLSTLYAIPSVLSFFMSTTDLSPLFIDNAESSYNLLSFLQSLFAYETTHTSNPATSHFLEVIDIMLPRDLSPSLYTEFALSLTSAISCPTFFYSTYHRGSATYMRLYCSERSFYPEGTTFKKIATSDFYRDPSTGRRCKQSDLAIKVWSKGDIIGTSVNYFSAKQRIFRVCVSSLLSLVSFIKRTIQRFLESQNLTKEKSYLIARISLECSDNKYARQKIVAYNKATIRAEEMLQHLFSLPTSTCNIANKIYILINRIKSIFSSSSGKVTINNHSFHYKLNFDYGFSYADHLDLMCRKISMCMQI